MQVALGGAGEDGDDDLAAIVFLARFLQGSPGHRAAADSGRDALAIQQVNGGGDGIVIGDGNDAVDQVEAQRIGQEAGAKSLDAVRSGSPA